MPGNVELNSLTADSEICNEGTLSLPSEAGMETRYKRTSLLFLFLWIITLIVLITGLVSYSEQVASLQIKEIQKEPTVHTSALQEYVKDMNYPVFSTQLHGEAHMKDMDMLVFNKTHLQDQSQELDVLNEYLKNKSQQVQDRDAQLTQKNQLLKQKEEQLEVMHRVLQSYMNQSENGTQVKKATQLPMEKDPQLANIKLMDIQLRNLTQQLKDMEVQLRNLAQQLKDKDVHLRNLTQQLMDKEVQLRNLTQQLMDKEVQLRNLTQQLMDKDMQLRHKAQKFKEKERQLRNMTQQIKDNNMEIQNASQILIEMNTKLRNTNQQLLDKDVQLKEKNQQLQDKDVQLKVKNEQLQDTDKLKNVGQKLKEMNNKLRITTQQLQDKETQLDTLRVKLEQKNAENSQLARQQNTLQRDVEELQVSVELAWSELSRKEGILQPLVWKWIRSAAVNVSLDPDTAHPKLILSQDGKQVYHADQLQYVSDNPRRFSRVICVLGKPGFSAGRAYYEVQVGEKRAWNIGLARESVNVKGSITASPENGFWVISAKNGNEYSARDTNRITLHLTEELQMVGVYVDYVKKQVSFYNADTRSHVYTYTNHTFTEKLYPFFSPGLNEGGRNSAPLIIAEIFETL